MEKPKLGKPVICSTIVFLGTLAFSCSVAAEFKKVKAKDMKLDGSLCSLPRSSAFGLGIAAVVCLSIAQIVGTSAVCIHSGDNKSRRSRIVSITLLVLSWYATFSIFLLVSTTLLVLSWISFGLATILLAAGSSMNAGQPYGKGWINGNCYMVRNGVFLGAAVLIVPTVVFTVQWERRSTIACTHLDEEAGRDHQQREVIKPR
ncbi:protein MODIFYING WALL LIGNIN-1-like isoform X1 [Phoenix dactylifera]|uniref:Protein MODIFYING WALL LIGNIN-1-like isoform X1 n=1 Tax=Phoenix dactylifera TaxID=42345 RepID=A0A8B8JBE1_PHODC|nr:protein MODIFYING WALL LIGNIN-1-like isoform X1 [Phoenix dactylifera]